MPGKHLTMILSRKEKGNSEPDSEIHGQVSELPNMGVVGGTLPSMGVHVPPRTELAPGAAAPADKPVGGPLPLWRGLCRLL